MHSLVELKITRKSCNKIYISQTGGIQSQDFLYVCVTCYKTPTYQDLQNACYTSVTNTMEKKMPACNHGNIKGKT